MENSGNKEILLSIVGIAVLVIALIGVSFAFFTYSKTGTMNNVITTGQIKFSYEDDSALTLENQFPKSNSEGAQNDKFTFRVIGQAPSTSSPINYTVYAIAGDPREGKTRMKDNEISLQVTSTGGTVTGSYQTGGVAGNSTSGFQIASGTIPASGVEKTDSYSLTMWVNDSVTISDTDANATYRASVETNGGANTGKAVYANLYYSLKIKVEANDNV